MGFADVGYRFRYMEWAKTVMEGGLPGVIDAGSSGIAGVSLRELGIRISDLELFGPHFYGEPVLRRRIARLARVSEDRVLPTLGASHALFLVCAALLSPGDEVIVETPAYEALAAVPRALGAKLRFLQRRFEDGFQFDPAELRRLRSSRTRLVLVTNLHNPSGVALSAEALAALAECSEGRSQAAGAARSIPRAGDRPRRRLAGSREPDESPATRVKGGARSPDSRRGAATRPRSLEPIAPLDAPMPPLARGTWVVANEVYRDFVFRDPPPAAHTLGPRAVSLSSLTKVYGLGETRVGWAIGDPALVHRALRINDFLHVNGPYVAERIGAFALARRTALLARTRTIVARNLPLVRRFLASASRLDLVPPAAGLVFFPRVRGVRDTRAFVDRAIRRHRVCVVPGEFFGAPGHLRIGIGAKDPRRLAEGLRRLGVALAEAAGHRS